jgi:hypothetical protein
MIVKCPHCLEDVIIQKVNCGVFCHGVYKDTGKQVSAHASQKTLKKLIKKNLIYGCGKTFTLDKNLL